MKSLTSNEIVAGTTERQVDQVGALLESGVVPHLAILRDPTGANERGIRSYTAALHKHIGLVATRVGLSVNQLVSLRTEESQDLREAVSGASEDPSVHGILVMSPTTEDYEEVVAEIDPAKDVDRMRSITRDLLEGQGMNAMPATPQAVHELLESRKLWKPVGTTLVGRGRTVGKYVNEDLRALHGENYDENVHVITGRNSHELPDAIAASEIVIVAAGVHHQIKPEYVHPDLRAIVGVCIEDIDPRVYEIPGDNLWVTPRHNDPNQRGIGAITSAIAYGNTLDAAAILTAPELVGAR